MTDWIWRLAGALALLWALWRLFGGGGGCGRCPFSGDCPCGRRAR